MKASLGIGSGSGAASSDISLHHAASFSLPPRRGLRAGSAKSLCRRSFSLQPGSPSARGPACSPRGAWGLTSPPAPPERRLSSLRLTRLRPRHRAALPSAGGDLLAHPAACQACSPRSWMLSVPTSNSAVKYLPCCYSLMAQVGAAPSWCCRGAVGSWQRCCFCTKLCLSGLLSEISWKYLC